MMPGGHLATALALAGTTYAATGSVEAAAGCFAGGFLIDVDHYLDYVVVEKQWQHANPLSFLRYYFSYSPKRLVLPLHSMELMTLLFAVIVARPIPLLVGYWFGAAMHLTFDMLVNGEYALKKVFFFYFFSYRASRGFAAAQMLDRIEVPEIATAHPIRDFFRWRPPFSTRPVAEVVKDDESGTFDLAEL
jgi:hypothetical protein